jgi:hypothetical protein
MNLPKQSRPVMRDVSRGPIRAQVEGAQLDTCLWACRRTYPQPGEDRNICEGLCHLYYGFDD